MFYWPPIMRQSGGIGIKDFCWFLTECLTDVSHKHLPQSLLSICKFCYLCLSFRVELRILLMSFAGSYKDYPELSILENYLTGPFFFPVLLCFLDQITVDRVKCFLSFYKKEIQAICIYTTNCKLGWQLLLETERRINSLCQFYHTDDSVSSLSHLLRSF